MLVLQRGTNLEKRMDKSFQSGIRQRVEETQRPTHYYVACSQQKPLQCANMQWRGGKEREEERFEHSGEAKVERSSLMGVACPATWEQAEVAVSSMWSCVYVHGSYYHQRPCRHLWSGVPPGNMLMSKDCAELAPPHAGPAPHLGSKEELALLAGCRQVSPVPHLPCGVGEGEMPSLLSPSPPVKVWAGELPSPLANQGCNKELTLVMWVPETRGADQLSYSPGPEPGLWFGLSPLWTVGAQKGPS